MNDVGMHRERADGAYRRRSDAAEAGHAADIDR
jgi:hypothetical protein